VVDRLARDTRFFRFIADCAPQSPTILGDARLALAAAPQTRYDLLMLDAFSSDSVPTHLLTHEAVRLYVDRLAPGGVLLFNISNRHLQLLPVLARHAGALGLAGRANATTPHYDERVFATPSRWVALARDPADLAFLDASPHWEPIATDTDGPAWTDDHADVLGAMLWSLD
jgi:spermidine synthase